MAEFINIHTHKIRHQGVELYNGILDNENPENIKYSLGLHPWDIAKYDIENYLKALENKIGDINFIAIGEIGIDRAIKTPVELQKEVFIKQVELANKNNLPVIIHSVRAHSDILQIKKQFKKTTQWIIHGFNGNPIEVKQLTDNGICLSFGEALLNNPKIHEAITATPLEYLFLETDESECSIEEIYTKAASIIYLKPFELNLIVYVNYVRIFM